MSELSVWQELIEEFCALGGRAENVRLGQGKFGRGLFPIDPSRAVELHTPENLLFPVDALFFEAGTLRVAPSSNAGSREIAWFERYAAGLSWGAGGREDVERFIREMRELPPEVRTELGNSFGLDYCLAPMSEDLVGNYFLSARAIAYHDANSKTGHPESDKNPASKKAGKVIMPIIELANFGDEATFEFERGVSLRGVFKDEVRVRYSRQDTLGLFQGWGFSLERAVAFSRCLSMSTPFGKLVVKRQLAKEKPHEIPDVGSVMLPELSAEGSVVTLSSVMLGNKLAPRLPRGIFQRLFREAGLPGADEIFDQVRHTNSLAFLHLLELLEGVAGPQAASLRAMARLQLTTMAHCYGSRPL
jgi:hypothetical protein